MRSDSSICLPCSSKRSLKSKGLPNELGGGGCACSEDFFLGHPSIFADPALQNPIQGFYSGSIPAALMTLPTSAPLPPGT